MLSTIELVLSLIDGCDKIWIVRQSNYLLPEIFKKVDFGVLLIEGKEHGKEHFHGKTFNAVGNISFHYYRTWDRQR